MRDFFVPFGWTFSWAIAVIIAGFLISTMMDKVQHAPPHWAVVCTRSHEETTIITFYDGTNFTLVPQTSTICDASEYRCVQGSYYDGPIKFCAISRQENN